MERISQNSEKYAENLLPTLVDVAGVENENSDLWKELLKIVFFGRLPEGEALYSAYQYGVKAGVQVHMLTKENFDRNTVYKIAIYYDTNQCYPNILLFIRV